MNIYDKNRNIRISTSFRIDDGAEQWLNIDISRDSMPGNPFGSMVRMDKEFVERMAFDIGALGGNPRLLHDVREFREMRRDRIRYLTDDLANKIVQMIEEAEGLDTFNGMVVDSAKMKPPRG